MSKEAMAFPGSGSRNDGMTLRDSFAGKVMQAIITSQEFQDGNWEIGEIARQSYEVADAMLRVRGQ